MRNKSSGIVDSMLSIISKVIEKDPSIIKSLLFSGVSVFAIKSIFTEVKYEDKFKNIDTNIKALQKQIDDTKHNIELINLRIR